MLNTQFSIAKQFWLALSLIALSSLAGRSFATELILETNDGPYDMSQYLGRVVLLDFWASWCGPCRESFPWMNSLLKRVPKDEFTIIAVNLDEDTNLADAFLREVPADFLVLYDSEGRTAEKFDLQGMPGSFLIGRDGKIVESFIGFSPARARHHAARIDALLDTHAHLKGDATQ